MTVLDEENKISAEAKASAEVVVETPVDGEELVMAAKIKVKEETKEEVKDENIKTNDIVEEDKNEPEVPAEETKEDVKEETKEEVKPSAAGGSYVSSTVVLTNTTYNTLYLTGNGVAITVAPREIKTVKKEDLKVLLKNQVIRNWFDKGILTSNLDADYQSAHEAEVPENLKGPVEKHDGVNISASVKKFVADTPLNINLG